MYSSSKLLLGIWLRLFVFSTSKKVGILNQYKYPYSLLERDMNQVSVRDMTDQLLFVWSHQVTYLEGCLIGGLIIRGSLTKWTFQRKLQQCCVSVSQSVDLSSIPCLCEIFSGLLSGVKNKKEEIWDLNDGFILQHSL